MTPVLPAPPVAGPPPVAPQLKAAAPGLGADLLRVNQLGVARGGRNVLEGLSFHLAAGEALVLRGPNGVGKTSLLRTLAGLAAASAGQIEAEPEGAAYAGHLDGVKDALSVAENLHFWAQVFGHGDVAAAMQALDLTSLAPRLAGRLSAGQRRRLGLARLALTGPALGGGRRLWLLDEPTVALDSQSVALFGALIGAHLAAGGGAVIATHVDLGLSARVLELAPFKARPSAQISDPTGFETASPEAFL